MNLPQILKEQLLSTIGPATKEVTHINYDSRKITNKGCFVCIKGDNTDGHLYIEKAVLQGAVQIIGDQQDVLIENAKRYSDVQFILVREPKKALALYSSYLQSHAHKEMSLIGVTGTYGKTTITAYIRNLLNGSGIKTGSIGTAGVWDHRSSLSLHRSTPTTPESSDLHAYLRRMRKRDISSVVMETTSIGLDQERLYGLHFDIAVHSNLKPEHLDYHGTFDQYKKAKLRLFDHANVAVVNTDDEGMSKDILSTFKGEIWTYGIHHTATVQAKNLKATENGSSFDLLIKDQLYDVFIPALGTHNIYNFLASLCVCLAKGLTIKEILPLFHKLEGPPGRLELIPEFPKRKMIFDFSHTPYALDNLLETIKPIPYKRLIIMITGIGIREKSLRAPIAKAVEGRADEIVVTADHPGDEDPLVIVNDVIAGFETTTENVHPVTNRGEAIKKAMGLTKEGDLILITGLCMEEFQIIKGKKVPYHDYDHVKEFLDSSDSQKYFQETSK
ncbi:UDP-N-acetylmuramoyl-L-alanyl-D-glutamate--2,6-diaminopimelate ligase [Salipaludibacillus daqingensis]|uniref:UDP-N-acetylmuramoyl-L-alanyl-D-glutamate--2, 6-diaminopimelate ligase n=1 Tax=Salipaludibacillus daqingensis TaxID=3041001 RepID=UPI0024738C95|nr:UDP-N-acetylmuramoyl-L-alanyl-D-glutamate--2,6-diaminopimelate ligase [Salipaludibacillus daqingensis]